MNRKTKDFLLLPTYSSHYLQARRIEFINQKCCQFFARAKTTPPAIFQPNGILNPHISVQEKCTIPSRHMIFPLTFRPSSVNFFSFWCFYKALAALPFSEHLRFVSRWKIFHTTIHLSKRRKISQSGVKYIRILRPRRK
jgi:hypothetical protein